MSTRDGGESAPVVRLADRRSRRVVPFWVLQATEILSVVGLADLSLHVSHGGVLAAVGAVFAALALSADGPLGVIRICSRRLHVILVMVVAVMVAFSPVVPEFRPDIEGIIILEFAAIGLIRLASLVNTDRFAHPPRPRGSGAVIDATATVTSAPASNQARGPNPWPGPGRASTGESVAAAARLAGRAAGAATSAAARSTAKHGPTAKAHLKRTIRSAGRLAGKAGSQSPSAPEVPKSKPS